jgi:3-hydroxyisobutyrate dehydrogenase-like beta-hydroxyacid dehydrogenase
LTLFLFLESILLFTISDEIFEKTKPVLSSMGKNIVHCGGTGTG